MEKFELYHFGIKGMHWGIRRYQNSDGSLTPAGIKRYHNTNRIRSINEKADEQIRQIKERSKIAKAESKAANRIAKAESKYLPKDKSSEANKQKPISEMSDDEIRAKINRVRLENELKSLSPQQVSKGQRFVESVINNVIAPAARDSGKKLLTDFLNKKGAELLGLDANKTKDAAKLLQEEVSYLTNLQKKDVLTKYFDNKQKEADANTKAEADAKNQATQAKEAEKQAQKAAERQAEQARKVAERQAEQARKEAEKRVDQAIKEAEKRAEQARKEAEKQAEQARKEAEKRAKQASKEARKQTSSTSATTSSNNYDYYVSGSGTSKRRTPNTVIIDADWKDVPVSNIARSSLVTRGQNYVASLTGSDGMLMLPYRGGR